MRIVIDHNSDRILINPDERFETAEIEFTKADMRYSILFVERFLEEILNKLDDSRLSSATPTFDVQLERISEDQHKTIGEW